MTRNVTNEETIGESNRSDIILIALIYSLNDLQKNCNKFYQLS